MLQALPFFLPSNLPLVAKHMCCPALACCTPCALTSPPAALPLSLCLCLLRQFLLCFHLLLLLLHLCSAFAAAFYLLFSASACRTLAHLAPCVCVCIYACSNLFIVCIFVYVLYIPRIHAYIYIDMCGALNKLMLLPLLLQFFRHFLLGVGRFIDCLSEWGRGSKGLPDCMAISIMHAQIIKLF